MNSTERISQALNEVFFGNNWTDVNIQQTLQEISSVEAQQNVPFTANTIAKIVYHLKYSNLIVAKRAEGNAIDYENEHEGFAAPVLSSEEDWQKLIQDTYDSAKILSQKIQNFDLNKLDEPIVKGFSSAYKNFQGSVEHAHYHLGQIVLIRKYLEKIND